MVQGNRARWAGRCREPRRVEELADPIEWLARGALARAMLAFDGLADETAAAGIDSAPVDHLLGHGPEWRFPVALMALGLASIAVLGAVALLAGRVAAGSATLGLPLLSCQPCVLVLSVIPAALALGGARYGQRRLRARTTR